VKPSRKKLRAMLEAAGARRTSAPTPAFVSNLEQRLLATAPDALAAPSDERELRRARRARLVLVPAAAAIAVVVVTGALVASFDGSNEQSPTRRLELSAAKDTVVELPDGSEVRGEPGLRLPEGAVVKTGPNGSATFGNVDLGPGQVATVKSGTVRISTPTTTAPTVPINLPILPPVTLAPLPVTIPTVPGLPLP
jgi:hypothetical protein